MRKWFLWMACLMTPFTATGHIGPKEVQSIQRPANRGGQHHELHDGFGVDRLILIEPAYRDGGTVLLREFSQ